MVNQCLLLLPFWQEVVPRILYTAEPPGIRWIKLLKTAARLDKVLYNKSKENHCPTVPPFCPQNYRETSIHQREQMCCNTSLAQSILTLQTSIPDRLLATERPVFNVSPVQVRAQAEAGLRPRAGSDTGTCSADGSFLCFPTACLLLMLLSMPLLCRPAPNSRR